MINELLPLSAEKELLASNIRIFLATDEARPGFGPAAAGFGSTATDRTGFHDHGLNPRDGLASAQSTTHTATLHQTKLCFKLNRAGAWQARPVGAGVHCRAYM